MMNNNVVMISIIDSLYNKEQWVERCIESIVNQSSQIMEILSINDGSTDDSRKVVATIDDSMIKFFDKHNGEN